ncbi:MAG: hypothetical protein ACYSWP_02195 [Planctomycetota bacterium]|jgi:hypothetical protein
MMGLISSGIERARAFELAGGIWADGDSVDVPRLALVRWYSSWSDKLYQVYVNGRFAGTTVDYDQREMVVSVPTSFSTAVRIEVFAVEPEDSVRDFSADISLVNGQYGRVRIRLLRRQVSPYRGTLQIYYNGGSGAVDYNNVISESPFNIWRQWQDKGGFGLCCFGESDFGYDSSAAIGFGKGSFGRGEFGVDAEIFEWVSGLLEQGVYKFGVKVLDESGNTGSATESEEITVIPGASPAEEVNVSSFDKEINQLVLSVS